MADATQDTSMSVCVEDIMRFAALECTKKAMKRLCDVKGMPNGSHANPFPYVNDFRYHRRDYRVPVLVPKTHTRTEKESGDIVNTSHHGVVKVLGTKSR